MLNDFIDAINKNSSIVKQVSILLRISEQFNLILIFNDYINLFKSLPKGER
mgnify:CR=1 FL=1